MKLEDDKDFRYIIEDETLRAINKVRSILGIDRIIITIDDRGVHTIAQRDKEQIVE